MLESGVGHCPKAAGAAKRRRAQVLKKRIALDNDDEL